MDPTVETGPVFVLDGSSDDEDEGDDPSDPPPATKVADTASPRQSSRSKRCNSRDTKA